MPVSTLEDVLNKDVEIFLTQKSIDKKITGIYECPQNLREWVRSSVWERDIGWIRDRLYQIENKNRLEEIAQILKSSKSYVHFLNLLSERKIFQRKSVED